jgi:hypothetical protein
MPEDKTFEQESSAGTVNLTNVDFSGAKQLSFYANHVAAQVTFFDVRLLLSIVRAGQGKLIAEETINLMMTPEFAIALKDTISAAIENFTQVYGPPRLPRIQPTPNEESPKE